MRPAQLLGIEQGEVRPTALVVALASIAMASYALGQSGIDALFFNRIGPQALPLLYLLQGASSFVAMIVLTGALARVGRRRFYLSAPLALAVAVLGERAVIQMGFGWIYFVLAVTGVVAGLVLGIFVWGTAGAVVDTRQAKRLFPVFAAGGIFGSVIGGALTPTLAHVVGAENLLILWAGGLGAVFLVSRVVQGPAAPAPLRRAALKRSSALRDVGATFDFVRRSRLLVWMSIAAVLFSICFYLLYLPYARASSGQFPKADDLAGFFGLFWAATTVAAFLTTSLVTNRLFAWRGVPIMVVVLAGLYAAAFGVLVIASGFVILVGLRFVLCTWLQGVASPGWEALTNVVTDRRRDQIRAFLNGGPTQVGTMIAGGLAIIGQQTVTSRQFVWVGLAAALLAIGATVAIRRSYAGALGDALAEGRPQVFEPWHFRQPLFLSWDEADSKAAERRDEATDDLLGLLGDPRTEAAALQALARMDIEPGRDRIRAFVRSTADRAAADRDLAAGVNGDDDASALLREAITDRGRRTARSALLAMSLLESRRDLIARAIDGLDGSLDQVAAAMETIEAAGEPALVRPLLTLWERPSRAPNGNGDGLAGALRDRETFIRECAELARVRRQGGPIPLPGARLSNVERVLFLRRVPLFARLSPLDLDRIAHVTQVRSYKDGEVIGGEGELGEELFVVVEGTVRVVQGREGDEREVARRCAGDVIGEMSVITQAPRIASLVAAGDVRTIPLGRREFESVLRERPEVGLAVMRVLVERLA
ncbi:MAG TPA: cyclic nucleotide-binding domain-containing protein [Candidatus Dormibacteraeota bacterium]|nr:cyclic nucleotide-binding domain-containing protein [Candidatus Dormibacteraeota bacterium]